MSKVEAKNFDLQFRQEIADAFATVNDTLDFTNCLSCGMCTAGCLYTDILENMDPRKFMRKVLLGLKEEVLNDPLIWYCTMCERCTMLCPMKVDIAGIVRTIRGNFGLQAPGHIQSVADLHIETGNQQGMTQEDYLDTIVWLEEELQANVKDPNAKIPIDKVGADILYVINSREAKFYPLDILNTAKIFYAAKANWTMSSVGWDATNLALFSGRDDDSTKIVGMVADAMARLKCKTLVVTECGHAIRSQVWGGEVWLNRSYPVKSIIQIVLDYLKTGKIRVRSDLFKDKYTYHDPCNLARKTGIIEEPREILRYLGIDLVEMWPNREYAICCGGGGGALSMENDRGLREIRIKKGSLKAEQMKKTGTSKLIVPCHNCFDQLADISKTFKLGIKLTHICSLVAQALILDQEIEGVK
ncbi:4Fe-4S ferredoxin, iron-sulphur binding, conserved site [Acididesulfobacillus acetoxydans]|uniref:4Fe-4S ferredoxin, iron-sulphur binding, conserved site n=1 Tax=Acididesulfobacillus acetoxydans TaxID=1561005 RepID=A0A8S0Y4V7_9FIRM|nr:(Fe-S)-binding protein [Acididesulfobacillus acetoxydans]CAA7603305.1 4Fe-4S ferredoxin, iron-sulphur binding, conserved site [Acididesulfobacillus acetoxydans]